MKTIGLIGGTSWQATIEYYRIINEQIAKELGGDHSAKMMIASVEFHELVALAKVGHWKKIAAILTAEANKLEKAGAAFFLICANTLHKVAAAVLEQVNIPLISIIDVTAEEIKAQGLTKVGLLGTRYTMSDGFYQKTMQAHNIEIITPNSDDQAEIHRIIFDELGKNQIIESSRQKHIEIINRLTEKGAQGVILGCTEIPLLIHQSQTSVPLFNTTELHALAAVTAALDPKLKEDRKSSESN